MTVASRAISPSLNSGVLNSLQGGVELLGILQVVDRVDVQDQVADEGDAGEALDPEGDVADVSPGVFRAARVSGLGPAGSGKWSAGLEVGSFIGPNINGNGLRG